MRNSRLRWVFPRGEMPTGKRAVLAKVNKIASKLADGKFVFYTDVNHLFPRPDGSVRASLMPDFEHPNEKGHRVLGDGDQGESRGADGSCTHRGDAGENGNKESIGTLIDRVVHNIEIRHNRELAR